MNIIDKINDLTSDATGLVAEKREFIFKQAINTVLLLIILLVFGCLDFMKAEFHIEYILDLSFWATVGSKLIAGICAFNVGINFMWDAEIKKNLDLLRNRERFYFLQQFKGDDFEYFVTKVYNVEMKIKAYISQINFKIFMLNKISRRRDRLLYSSDLATREEKMKNRYCRIRQELEDLKTDEYIKKNLDSLNVRYREVDPAIFELEIDGSKPEFGVKVKGSAAIGKVKASSGVAVGMLGFAMFTTGIVFEFNQQQFVSQVEAFWHYLLKCVEDVGIVMWQIFRGMLKTRKIISSELTQPYAGRISVHLAYQKWIFENNKISKEEYDYITEVKEAKDEEVLEMTEEEYNKIKGGN